MSGLNGRTLPVPRGHVLGGSSSVSTSVSGSSVVPVTDFGLEDGLVYTRGSRDDYANWAQVTGDSGWEWEAVWPYILRVRPFLTVS